MGGEEWDGMERDNKKRKRDTMTITQRNAIKCAYLDLIGAKQAKEQCDIHAHDWNAHESTIEELEQAFKFLVGESELR
jgi:hypothetical protein